MKLSPIAKSLRALIQAPMAPTEQDAAV